MTNEERITSVLEKAPIIAVPEGFTARVLSSLPAKRAYAPPRHTHYGRNAMVACAVVLCALLLAVPQASQHGSLAGVMTEWICFAQLAGIALWLSLSPHEGPS